MNLTEKFNLKDIEYTSIMPFLKPIDIVGNGDKYNAEIFCYSNLLNDFANPITRREDNSFRIRITTDFYISENRLILLSDIIVLLQLCTNTKDKESIVDLTFIKKLLEYKYGCLDDIFYFIKNTKVVRYDVIYDNESYINLNKLVSLFSSASNVMEFIYFDLDDITDYLCSIANINRFNDEYKNLLKFIIYYNVITKEDILKFLYDTYKNIFNIDNKSKYIETNKPNNFNNNKTMDLF